MASRQQRERKSLSPPQRKKYKEAMKWLGSHADAMQAATVEHDEHGNIATMHTNNVDQVFSDRRGRRE